MICCFFLEAFFFGGRAADIFYCVAGLFFKGGSTGFRAGATCGGDGAVGGGGLEPEEAALEPEVAVLEPELVALELEVVVLESEVVALEPKVVALETEATQSCLALPHHHPQHYDMLMTVKPKRYMRKPLSKRMQNKVSGQMYRQFSSAPRIRFMTRRWW